MRDAAWIEDLEGEQGLNDLIDSAIAAIQSGVLFAAGKAKISGIEVTVQHMQGCVGNQGLTGFAVAATLEVFRCCAPHLQLEKSSFQGWSLEGFGERRG
jgi:hypothetical protein